MATIKKRARTDYIVVHVSATPEGRDLGIKDVTAMHRARGWDKAGYSYVIRLNGKVESDGLGDDIVRNQVAGFNSISLGVCIIGGVDKNGKPKDTRTAAQTAALETLLVSLCKKYPKAVICGHRDLSPDQDKDGFIEATEHIKACPCFDAIPWAKSVNLPYAPIKGDWSKGTITPPKPNADEERNRYLQKLLKLAGFYSGALDGDVGKKTKEGIAAYQLTRGLKKTEKFDTETVASLRNDIEGKPTASVIKASAMITNKIIADSLPATGEILLDKDGKVVSGVNMPEIIVDSLVPRPIIFTTTPKTLPQADTPSGNLLTKALGALSLKR